MKNILWISRHSPRNEQIKELEESFNEEINLITITTTIENVNQIKQYMEKYKCSDVVTVLPLNLMGQLTGMGIKPIRAVMSRENVNGETIFHHERFERIQSVDVIKTKI